MTRQHRTPPGLVVLGFAAVIAGCGGAGGGSMSGTAGRAAAGASGGGGSASSAGASGTAGAPSADASGTAGASPGAAGAKGTAGSTGTAGVPGTAGAAGAPGATTSVCDAAGLVWKTGSKTNFTSYPAPGSAECIQYSGCMYEGEFAGCDQTEPLAWVMSHDIVAAFPDFTALKLHDLCLKSSTGKTIVVTVLDTCGDSDCNGCCTQNKGNADELIDVESFTDMRWGVPDGRIQWADLGPTKTSGCK